MRSLIRNARPQTIRIAASLLLSASAALSQTQQPRPSFEAASVKPMDQSRPAPRALRGGPGTNSPGQLSGSPSLKDLLKRAYELKDYQISGPAWMDSERYEITAKIPPGASKAQVSLMLQTLLADRFQLVIHRETRELPILAMVVGKNGPKFKTSPDQNAVTSPEDATARQPAPKLIKGSDGFPDVAPGADLPRSYEVVVGGSDGVLYKLWVRRETMQQLADRLASRLNRPVADMTGLKERYDFALAWTSDAGSIPRTDPPPDQIETHNTPVMSDSDISIFTAIQAQLGLRLEQTRGPQEMLIVEKADKTPTGN